MKVSEVQTRIGGSIRISYNPYIFNRTEISRFYKSDEIQEEDDRIGATHTTIRVPANEEIAYSRYNTDHLFRAVVQEMATHQVSDPHAIMAKYAGQELTVKNTLLGVDHCHSDNTPISASTSTENGCKSENQPNVVVRLIKRILP